MADSPISSLPAVENLPNGQPNIEADDLFVLEHINDGQKKACKVSGDQVTKFVNRNVVAYDGSIVESDAAGGANYDPNTEKLTLVLPHGAGIAEVIQKPSTVENDRVVDWYALKTEDAQYTGTKELGKELTPWIKVTNGKDGQGTVNSVMGIAPGGSPANPFVPSLDVPKSVLMDYIHPVGSIYMTQLPISPALIFGGTWLLIHDKFLLAAGSSYAIDTFGGSATKQLTAANIPSHTHELLLDSPVGSVYDHLGLYPSNNIWNTSSSSSAAGAIKIPDSDNVSTVTASKAYSDNPTSVNILPPYRTVYVWLRTSPDYTDYDKEVIVGKYVQTNATINVHSYANNNAYNTILIACSAGDQFTLTGTSTSGAVVNSLYAFVGADGNRKKRSATDETATNKLLTAPANTAYLVVNYKSSEPFSLVGGDATGE